MWVFLKSGYVKKKKKKKSYAKINKKFCTNKCEYSKNLTPFLLTIEEAWVNNQG